MSSIQNANHNNSHEISENADNIGGESKTTTAIIVTPDSKHRNDVPWNIDVEDDRMEPRNHDDRNISSESKRKNGVTTTTESIIRPSATKKMKGSPKKHENDAQQVAPRTESFDAIWSGNVFYHRHMMTENMIMSETASSTHWEEEDDEASSFPNIPPHTLILGTHPSITSLTKGQFYGHPMKYVLFFLSLHVIGKEFVGMITYSIHQVFSSFSCMFC
jgi:hypothetical protein